MIGQIFTRVRSRTDVIPAFLPFGAVVVFLFAMNVFMDAQTLTEDQAISAEFGHAVAHVAIFDVELAPGDTVAEDIRDLAQQRNPQVDVAIGAVDFPYYAAGARGIAYRERDWRTTDPEARYRLIDGSWPSAPREVVIIGGPEGTSSIGDEVATLGGGRPLTVVGIGRQRWSGGPVMLAGSGTWAGLEKTTHDSGLIGFPIFELSHGAPRELSTTVDQTLDAMTLATGQSAGSDLAGDRTAQARVRVRTAADAVAEIAPLWSERSPLSLRVPGLILVPATVLVGYSILSRRLARSGRRMLAQGAAKRHVVTGLWLVPVPAIAALLAGGALVGGVTGWALAEGGAGNWGYYVANLRLPSRAALLAAAGTSASLMFTWAFLQNLVSEERTGRRLSHMLGGTRRLRPVRQVLAGAGACISLWFLLTTDSSTDAVWLTGAATATVALLTPEMVQALIGFVPDQTLSQRLVSRQISHNRGRVALACTAYISLVAVTLGMLVVLASYKQDLRTRHPSAPPAGQVLVDNGGNTFLGVDPGVRAAVESVPALRDQDPVQFFLIGDRTVDEEGSPEVHHSVGTMNYSVVSYAFASIEDVESAYGRHLTRAEHAMLADGGVLVPRPDRVSISDGQIELVDLTSNEPVAKVDALAAEPVPTPWADTAFVTLVRTAESIGLPMEPAALLYRGIADEDADRAEQALIARGYSPRSMNKHERPPAVIPTAAVAGSTLGLVILVVVMSVLMTKSQVKAMRSWATQLTHIGLRSRWAEAALVKQYLWVLGLSLPVASITVLACMGVTKLRLPTLDVVIPWAQCAAVLAAVLATTLIGAAMAARKLDAAEDTGL